MIDTLSAVFWGVLTFSILVVLHEGGHFVVARAFGVKVHEFMLGLPGPAIRWQGKNTVYGITALPLGGYVRIAGMEPGPEDPRLGAALAFVTARRLVSADDLAEELGLELADADGALVTLVDWGAIRVLEGEEGENTYEAIHQAEAAQDPNALLDVARSITYRGLSTWKRIAVLSAGVIVNLLSAVLVFVLVLTLYGVPTPTLKVDLATTGSAAAAAGIKAGDTLRSVDGKPLADFDALLTTLDTSRAGDEVSVEVIRSGETVALDVTLGRSESGQAQLGVQVTSENVRLTPLAALKESVMWIGLVFKAIAGFFNPATFQESVDGSRSVVGISVIVAQAAERGPIDYAFLVALLSLSLGVMNILPIPPLDGGKVAIEIIEAIAHRPLPRKVAYGLSLAGAVLLFSFIGYLMYADVARFVQGG